MNTRGRPDEGGTPADERGNGTVLAAGVMLGVLAFGVGAVVHGGYVVTAHQAAGAADLVALSGAQAKLDGADPCAAASLAARANEVELMECATAGDDIDFAVTVTVVRAHPSPLPGLPDRLRATAVAGSLDGGH